MAAKNNTVLISGASGLFGQLACRTFKDLGYCVLRAGRGPDNDVEFDLSKPDLFARTKYNKKIDIFIHAAASNEIDCLKRPYESMNQNVTGTKAALDFSILNGINYFVYISTFHVFGHPDGKLRESSTPFPRNDYGMTHLLAEQYVTYYRRLFKLKTLIVRPTNLFGLPLDLSNFKRWTLIPYGFPRDGLASGKITLRTPGRQYRNFISANDVCKLVHKIIHLDEAPEIIHASGPDHLQVIELANMVKSIFTEKFGLNLEVLSPSGQASEPNFCFASEFDFCHLERYERINDFLEELIRALR